MAQPPHQDNQEPRNTQAAEQKQSPDGSNLQKTFKCRNCAAEMRFVPGQDAQKCSHCGHENPIPKSEQDIKELDFRSCLAKLSDTEQTQEQLTVKCEDCGAETTTDHNVTASECPFCGSHIVSSASSSRHIKPRSLLPFDNQLSTINP